MEPKNLEKETSVEAEVSTRSDSKVSEEKNPDSSEHSKVAYTAEQGGEAADGSADDDEGEEHSKVADTAEQGLEAADGGGDDDEGEEGECGFCLFMKGGGCKESFISWEKCVEEAEAKEEDISDKCFQVTSLLKTCMDQHADYYRPILQAEKRAEEAAMKELEREKAIASSEKVNASSETPEPENASSSSEESDTSIASIGIEKNEVGQDEKSHQ